MWLSIKLFLMEVSEIFAKFYTRISTLPYLKSE